MPERVVDQLEAVEVKEEHGRVVAVAPRLGDGLADAVVKQRSVGQAGERVVVGEEMHVLLGLLALGDVRESANVIRGPPGGVTYDAD